MAQRYNPLAANPYFEQLMDAYKSGNLIITSLSTSGDYNETCIELSAIVKTPDEVIKDVDILPPENIDSAGIGRCHLGYVVKGDDNEH